MVSAPNLSATPANPSARSANSDMPETEAQEKARKKAAEAWLNASMRPDRNWVQANLLAGYAAGAAVILQAWLIAYVLTEVIAGGQRLGDIGAALIALAAVIVFRATATGLRDWLAAMAATRLKTRLRDGLAQVIAWKGPTFIEARGSGAILAAGYEQVDALEPYVARYKPQRMLAGLVPLTIILAIMPFNWLLSLIFVFTGPSLIILMALVGIGAAAAGRRQMGALERLGGYFADRLRGLDTLRLLGAAYREAEKIETVAEDFRRRTMEVLRLAFLSSAVLEFMAALAVALIAVFVGLTLLRYEVVMVGPLRDLTFQTGLFVLLLAPEFYQPLRLLGQYYHDRATAVAAAENLKDILEEAHTSTSLPADEAKPALVSQSPPAITFQDVSAAYADGERPALHRVSFELQPGQTTALTGKSGAGKSTLLNLLMGFVAPREGLITVDQEPMDVASLRQRMAFVPQRTHLFAGTIAQNIALGHAAPERDRIEQAAQDAHVADFVRRLPDGLDTEIGENGHGLSGGEAQRVALARAFYRDAPFILMDEPTAHLDRESTELIVEALNRLLPGRTALIATHTDAVLRLCSARITLEAGRVVRRGVMEPAE